MVRDEPTFNLRAVVKETGLKGDTLRAWERRYGLPNPKRSAGGHRLYSERDIVIIQWLIARQQEGLSISHAVEYWRELERRGEDPLAAAAAIPAGTTQDIAALRSEWLQACLQFNETAAAGSLTQAFALHRFDDVIQQVIVQGLHEIGERWYRGEASVHQEHFSSEMASRSLSSLIAATPAPTRPQTILITTPPGELHALPSLVLALFLRRRGYAVVNLGANVPVQLLVETVHSIAPNLVLTAAQRLNTAAALRTLLLALQAKKVTAGYGGAVFSRVPQVRIRMPAHYLGDTLQEAVAKTEQLLASSRRDPSDEPPGKEFLVLAQAFRTQLPMINAAVTAEMIKLVFPFEHLHTAKKFLAQEIVAGLELGDLETIDFDLRWLIGMQRPETIDPANLSAFLNAYRRVVDTTLGKQAAAISTWLKTQIEQYEGIYAE